MITFLPSRCSPRPGKEVVALRAWVYMVQKINVVRVVEVVHLEEPLDLRYPVLREVGALRLFVHHEILCPGELGR